MVMNWLFSKVWAHRLGDKDVVVRVKGWRTALIDKDGYTRMTITYMFWWEWV
jgi:hypothetical protein